MNHKRKGPKSTRAGCLLCKPHKHQSENGQRRQELRARITAKEQIEEVGLSDNNPKNGGRDAQAK